jgi:phage repressor protein C with HTH and peptisase S24 domain
VREKSKPWVLDRLETVLNIQRMEVDKSTSAEPAILLREASGANLKLRLVPVVSFARAGQDGFSYDDLGTHFDELVPTTSTDPNAFALRVEGDSMESKYSPGDILVVNPNEEPRNGDLVVARLQESGGVLFKRYHQVSPERVKLTSYNKDLYPPLEYNRSEFRFIYPIVNVLSNPRGRP